MEATVPVVTASLRGPEARWSKLVPVLAAFVLLAAFPAFGSGFYVDLVGKVMILAIFAMSLELLVGKTGLVSFGHAAFFGIGAYAVALVTAKVDAASVWLVVPVAIYAGVCVLAIWVFRREAPRIAEEL